MIKKFLLVILLLASLTIMLNAQNFNVAVASEVLYNDSIPSGLIFKPGRILDNGQTIWLSGDAGSAAGASYVFLSTDGGQTFTQSPAIEGRVANLDAFDANTALIAMASGHIWKTEDGGESWIDVYSYSNGEWFDGLRIINDSVAVAFGDGPNDGYMHFVRTEDRGEFWDEISGIDYMNSAYAIYSWGTAIMNIGDTIFAGACNSGYNQAYFYRSYDAGITWETFEVMTGISGRINGVAMINGQQGLASGRISAGVSVILATTDGGETWDECAQPGDSATYINSVTAIPGTNIIVAGGDANEVFYTDDLGATWESVVVEGEEANDFLGGLFLNQNTGYMFTYNGPVYEWTGSGAAAGGTWEFVEDVGHYKQPHGVVVDNDGKIWIGCFGVSDTLIEGDSTTELDAIIILNPDGTHASFSPLGVLTNDGDINDTLFDAYPYSCRGISKDANGNILFCGGAILWRLDASTGKVIDKFAPNNGSFTQASADANNYIYVGHVSAAKPGHILDGEDLSEYAQYSASVPWLSRSIVVSDDGKWIVAGRIYSDVNGLGILYSEDGPDGTYEIVDTVGSIFTYDETGAPVATQKMWAQCVNWGPYGNADHQMLYVGTYWDVAAATETTPGDWMRWYILDPMNNYAIIDSFGTPGAVGGIPIDAEGATIPPAGDQLYAPRGCSFSPDGQSMYTADFDGNIVKKWRWSGGSAIGNVKQPIVSLKNFDLFQNYPNPFNPTTLIPFELKQNAKVTLEIYNLMGQKVVTLLDENRSAGRHEVRWDATGQATGTYLYLLKVDNKLQSKKMLFVK